MATRWPWRSPNKTPKQKGGLFGLGAKKKTVKAAPATQNLIPSKTTGQGQRLSSIATKPAVVKDELSDKMVVCKGTFGLTKPFKATVKQTNNVKNVYNGSSSYAYQNCALYTNTKANFVTFGKTIFNKGNTVTCKKGFSSSKFKIDSFETEHAPPLINYKKSIVKDQNNKYPIESCSVINKSQCDLKPGYYWNTKLNDCQKIPSCPTGQIFNKILSPPSCSETDEHGCHAGEVYKNKKCECSVAGQTYDIVKKKCSASSTLPYKEYKGTTFITGITKVQCKNTLGSLSAPFTISRIAENGSATSIYNKNTKYDIAKCGVENLTVDSVETAEAGKEITNKDSGKKIVCATPGTLSGTTIVTVQSIKKDAKGTGIVMDIKGTPYKSKTCKLSKAQELTETTDMNKIKIEINSQVVCKKSMIKSFSPTFKVTKLDKDEKGVVQVHGTVNGKDEVYPPNYCKVSKEDLLVDWVESAEVNKKFESDVINKTVVCATPGTLSGTTLVKVSNIERDANGNGIIVGKNVNGNGIIVRQKNMPYKSKTCKLSKAAVLTSVTGMNKDPIVITSRVACKKSMMGSFSPTFTPTKLDRDAKGVDQVHNKDEVYPHNYCKISKEYTEATSVESGEKNNPITTDYINKTVVCATPGTFSGTTLVTVKSIKKDAKG
ncbi:hypothetical protein EBR66_06290, partial [bacterium]|nr:hypothetical protein [bacterium]